jgi:sporulation protein YlmC with PRC-barrel domain
VSSPRRRIVRLEDLLGRRVRTTDGAVVGRIEEVRAVRRGDDHEVTEYLIGPGALRERLALVGRLFGPTRTLRARWDQLDIRNVDAPTLTCRVEQLKHVDT